MIKKTIAIAVVLSVLVGCGTTKPLITRDRSVVVMPNEAQLRCPDLPMVPTNIERMTDTDVAEYILELYQTGRICKSSLEGVRDFLLEAQKITQDAHTNE